MLDRLITSLLNLKLKDGSVRIIGCGQDMFSATLYEFLNCCRDIVSGLNMPIELNGNMDAAWYYKFKSYT